MKSILSNFGIVTIILILINIFVFFAIQMPDKQPYYTLEWTTDCKQCEGTELAEYKGEKYICPSSACDYKGCYIDKCEKLSECCIHTRTDRFSLISKYALQEPWLFITSMFMHANIEHLLGNMIFLFLLGGIVENIIGRKNYILLYFAAGIFGGIVMILMANVGMINDVTPILGASGAIFGVLAAAAILRPKEIIYIDFIPVPLIFLGILYIGLQVYYILIGGEEGVANGAHLGGAIIGIIFAYYYLKKIYK